ncbi:MAG: methylenetetrahydrofolate--tRNA-(uracil(54)-C(5))-methyltransferase (FADH(2)-oxidizing) TrmFO [Deltaproteobacteria bacterium]|nr:methylenetetrahydrofolate--tRNA-(uracil(54)-C(5))-methyltransferase (FADH(2)-oxidizing) TrmFO [Deltaproteobacteria bacterium]MBW2123548.1 methylenetetrahydrofolate--tRNA-(uracil(54)-C(5))-methyltransferase (FADH(2)-oxidizing) TrmFO [Deltaproteobacteria bacterium]
MTPSGRFYLAGEERLLIIGGGLAGCEAAWQASRRGIRTVLYEMKPHRFSPAHKSPLLSELVCSNSLKSESLDKAVGLLKEEMRRLGSLIIRAADQTRVPAGVSLAVDREEFSRFVTESLEREGQVEIIRREITEMPAGGAVIVATGPLTSEPFGRSLSEMTGRKALYFYDAVSPIVLGDSIDFAVAFKASRYGRGGDDYVNCPMTRQQYYDFVDALVRAERVPLREFEKEAYFEGCMPVEELARRGRETLAFGSLKPVGLVDPRTGERPFAVVQLRQDNREGTLYSMVGFQTKLKWEEQKRVFRMIPGLQDAEFVRLGSVHRNTFVNSPLLLRESLQLKGHPRIFLAGQITGVEGYVESAAMGLLAGISASLWMKGEPMVTPSPATAIGSLLRYVTHANPATFQPMNANFGLFPPLETGEKGRQRRRLLALRGLEEIDRWKASVDRHP